MRGEQSVRRDEPELCVEDLECCLDDFAARVRDSMPRRAERTHSHTRAFGLRTRGFQLSRRADAPGPEFRQRC
jgi:hypothetical protein